MNMFDYAERQYEKNHARIAARRAAVLEARRQQRRDVLHGIGWCLVMVELVVAVYVILLIGGCYR